MAACGKFRRRIEEHFSISTQLEHDICDDMLDQSIVFRNSAPLNLLKYRNYNIEKHVTLLVGSYFELILFEEIP